MLNRLRVSAKNLLAAALCIVACSGESARKEAASDVAPAGAGSVPSSSPAGLAQKRYYIGIRYRALPAGVTTLGGAVVRIEGVEYALTSVRTPNGEMVWLVAVEGRSGEKAVRAELRVPPLARDERLLMASCDVDGRLDGRVVAVVVNEPNATKFTKVRQAWRVDVGNARFDVIPVAGITCEDPGAS
jgi:hypothetical protein